MEQPCQTEPAPVQPPAHWGLLGTILWGLAIAAVWFLFQGITLVVVLLKDVLGA